MLPVAMGMGDGGKILAPLGITVTGGLWLSMLFTLFAVPALKVTLENSRIKKNINTTQPEINQSNILANETVESNSWQ
jgi:HAE1 family hydrophobic/amphiphilic exporter-1